MPSRRKPWQMTLSFFWGCNQKTNFSLPHRMCKGPKLNTVGIKEISGEWTRDNLLVFLKDHLPLLCSKKVPISQQLPLYKVTRVYKEKIYRFGFGLLVHHQLQISAWTTNVCNLNWVHVSTSRGNKIELNCIASSWQTYWHLRAMFPIRN